ncbi:MAG TPA: cation:proton antiporter [Bacteroidaceae bacterium]|nr:cation:proton antiporter [Bacteroidaceae bacterium]
MNKKLTLIYVFVVSVFAILMYGLLNGHVEFNDQVMTDGPVLSDIHNGVSNLLKGNIVSPLMTMLIQIIIILITCRIFTMLFRLIGQPSVIGEIIAGIVLGPSVFGFFFPNAFNIVFAQESLGNVHMISHIGLILFMFVIGLEVDFKVLKNKLQETLLISHTGIMLSFLLGVLLSYKIYEDYAAQQTSFLPFALFIGISMSITAFPVLARIIQERNLSNSPIGILTIAAAANDDMTAWCLLAVVIAIAKAGSFVSSLFTIGLAVLYILFMFLLVRPYFRKIGQMHVNTEVLSKSFVGLIFLVLIISASLTELIGIHALFGAFIAGVIMPSNMSFRHILANKVEDVTLSFFLPLFFAYTGLKTNLLLINNWSMVGLCLLFILVAIVGKFGGCAIAARLAGESRRDSITIGILMNTKGLMELVALNIGYEMGILTQPIFAVLVIMAVVTTFLTTPVLQLTSLIFKKRSSDISVAKRKKLMISFGSSSSGPNLLYSLNLLFGPKLQNKTVIASHFTQGTDVRFVSAEHYSHDSFVPIDEEADRLGIPLVKYYKLTNNIINEISDYANSEKVGCLIIGSSYHYNYTDYISEKKAGAVSSFLKRLSKKSLPEIFKDKTEEIIQKTKCDVFVLINREKTLSVSHVSIIFETEKELRLFDFVPAILPSVKTVHIFVSSQLSYEKCGSKINKILHDNPDQNEKIVLHRFSQLQKLTFSYKNEHLIMTSYQLSGKLFRVHPSHTELPPILGANFKDQVDPLSV